MADGLRAGWEFDNKSDNTNVIKAKVSQKSSVGSSEKVEIVSNVSTGNFDIYETRLIGGRPAKPIITYNASNDKVDIVDRAAYNTYYSGQAGQAQFNQLLNNAKAATLDNSQILTGTDPIRNRNFDSIKAKPGYKSLANKAKPGERIAPPGDSNTQQGGDTKPGNEKSASKEDADKLAKESATSNKNTRKSYDKSSIRYPENLNLTQQDCIKFTIIEYKASGQKSATTPGGVSEANRKSATGRKILTSIHLPIPGGISDSNSVDWQGDTLSEIQQIGVDIAAGLIQGGASEGTQAAQSGVSKAAPGGNTQALESIVTSKFAGKAVGANNLQQRLFGTIINPNLELLFNAPNLREFSFFFRLSPRSPSEAKIVRKIIRYFKQAMSVKRSESSLLLKTPHTFLISYLTSEQNHPYLNRFKECALTNCSVNYAPDQTYMTFGGDIDDRSMTAYELQLNFQELEPIFDDDYYEIDENKDTAIGY